MECWPGLLDPEELDEWIAGRSPREILEFSLAFARTHMAPSEAFRFAQSAIASYQLLMTRLPPVWARWEEAHELFA